MNKYLMLLLSICVFSLVSFTACERYPISALNKIHSSIDSWPDPWLLYDDEINTKGSMEPFVWDNSQFLRDNTGTLNFACTESPAVGRHCIKMTWIGKTSVHGSYAGFGLMATESSGGKKDLSKSGYTYLKFYIKGRLYTNCTFKLEIPDYDIYETFSEYNIPSQWQEVSIPIPNVGVMTAVEYYIAMSLSGLGNGGTVYIDNIRFCKS